jgi:hypothetical protein
MRGSSRHPKNVEYYSPWWAKAAGNYSWSHKHLFSLTSLQAWLKDKLKICTSSTVHRNSSRNISGAWELNPDICPEIDYIQSRKEKDGVSKIGPEDVWHRLTLCPKTGGINEGSELRHQAKVWMEVTRMSGGTQNEGCLSGHSPG